MVDPQRSKLLVGTLKVEKETSERNEDSPGNNDCQSWDSKPESARAKAIANKTHMVSLVAPSSNR
jgi:hypothetical protein